MSPNLHIRCEFSSKCHATGWNFFNDHHYNKIVRKIVWVCDRKKLGNKLYHAYVLKCSIFQIHLGHGV